MSALIFRPDSGNQWEEFERESKAASAFWNARVVAFPALKLASVQRRFVIDTLTTLRPPEPLGRVAFLCHGFRNRIQAGFDMDTAGELAEALSKVATPNATVSLYCCSTGRSSRDDGAGPFIDGEGSFADKLRDELVARGFRNSTILTHRTAGHLSRNPDVRIYDVERGALGGADVCLRIPLDPKATPAAKTAAVDLYKRFRGLLHTPNGRWEIADMTAAEIETAARACKPYVPPIKRK